MIRLRGILLTTTAVLCQLAAAAQPPTPALYSALRWRLIGPFRGGRTVAVCGVPGEPGVFFMAPNDGGVWKSVNYGLTWQPIFDQEPAGSIGALAVAPSDPNVIYVGSGEGLQRPDLSVGDGVYRSDDGGITWQHLGLRDGEQIPALAVDPADPNRVFAAVLGHPYGANSERGLYRSTDGGKTWRKVLYKDDNTGAVTVVLDPADSNTVYAALWCARQPPWEAGDSWNGPGSGLYKSTDGGDTWRQLTTGLPAAVTRIGLAIAPSDPSRLYATVGGKDGGVYRSDNAGESWRRVNTERRVWGRTDDFAEVEVDPRNLDTVWVANTSTYRSTDGGATFTAVKGAPGGDDYHRIWLDPRDPRIMILGVDQGATVSVDGGETWSSWYNQPTAQFYHVAVDNRFPYWVYGAQQESGSAGVAGRGNSGAITHRDWITAGSEEYGYIAPDPLDPDILYGGKVTRFNRRTGDVQDVSPEAMRSGRYRYVRTLPLVFSPVDKRALYFGANVVFKTRDGGRDWQIVSPDLTRKSYELPPSMGIFKALDPEMGKHRGVIYTLAPSPRDASLLWAGTDDGLIHVTRDGGRAWRDVTPPDLTPWSKVSLIEAGHFDTRTAYAAVNRFRLDDLRPHIYRTHDGGATWTPIVNGIQDNEVVNAVREDPVRPGLLYCGTEHAVYVSLDDGDHWLPLRLNMPVTSVRDLAVHDDDLIAATHGRSFWILDDITPLRQIAEATAQARAVLFAPAVAYRVRRSVNTDTPLPPEEPMGENPPDGAIIDYWLGSAAQKVTLDIRDANGALVREYSSSDTPPAVNPDDLDIPTYWLRPPRTISAAAGAHRWVWDLRMPPPDVPFHYYPIAAIPHDTPRRPGGPRAMAGRYTAQLTVDGVTYTKPLMIRPDPRVTTPAAEQMRAHILVMEAYDGIRKSAAAIDSVQALQKQAAGLQSRARGGAATALGDFTKQLSALAPSGGGGGAFFFRARPAGAPSLNEARQNLTSLMGLLDGSDGAPTSQATDAVKSQIALLHGLLDRWAQIRAKNLPALNAGLRAAGLPELHDTGAAATGGSHR